MQGRTRLPAPVTLRQLSNVDEKASPPALVHARAGGFIRRLTRTLFPVVAPLSAIQLKKKKKGIKNSLGEKNVSETHGPGVKNKSLDCQ